MSMLCLDGNLTMPLTLGVVEEPSLTTPTHTTPVDALVVASLSALPPRQCADAVQKAVWLMLQHAWAPSEAVHAQASVWHDSQDRLLQVQWAAMPHNASY